MSKIDEMAERFATEGDEFSGLQVIEIKKDAYIRGANAVLREIEQLVSKFDTHPGYRYNDLYTRMKDKIRELKGE